MSDSTVPTVSKLPTATDPALAASLQNLPGFERQVKKTLDQGDFLKLLSTQLANQDPLDPISDTNSVAQMATFSSIAQMGTLVTNLQSFMTQQTWTAAQGYLGKWVLAQDSSGITTGMVTSVAHDSNGNPVLTINGKDISPSSVTQVRDSAPGTANKKVTTGGTTDGATDGPTEGTTGSTDPTVPSTDTPGG